MTTTPTTQAPRDHLGRIVSRRCPDPNCGGNLAPDSEPGTWRCDGLTHEDTDGSQLVACGVTHEDGSPFDATPCRSDAR